MTPTDIYISLVVFLSFWFAYRNGFIGEMLKIGAYVLSGIGCVSLLPSVQPAVERYIPYPPAAKSIAACALSFVLFLFFRILARQIKDCVVKGVFRQIDRAAGGVFGIARGYAFVVLFALALATLSPDKAKETAKDSLFFPTILETADEIKDWFGSFSLSSIGDKIDDVKEEIGDAKTKTTDSLKEKVDDISDGLLP